MTIMPIIVSRKLPPPSTPLAAPSPRNLTSRWLFSLRCSSQTLAAVAATATAASAMMWNSDSNHEGCVAWAAAGGGVTPVSRPVVVAGKEGSPDVTASTAGEGGGMGRARSLTDSDLEELKGCMDLGFNFSYHEIPELCSTLPTLELCYSMSQRFLDEHQQLSKIEETLAAPASPSQPIATNGKISNPRDNSDEVKVRLKYWAQAVACTVKLCS